MGTHGGGARGVVGVVAIAALTFAPPGRAEEPAGADRVDEVDAWIAVCWGIARTIVVMVWVARRHKVGTTSEVAA